VQETRVQNHLDYDYSSSVFLKQIGYTNPRPIVSDSELLVECDGGLCVSRNEALGRYAYLPTPKQIKKRAKRVRERRIHHFSERRRNEPGIREIPVPPCYTECLEE